MVLDRLSDDHREALALKYLNDLSVDEIAAVMGRSSAAVNSLLQRAREAFANAAGDRFQEDFL
jgi:RNA polymerase sigma-70 factor (ECF subfamily)